MDAKHTPGPWVVDGPRVRTESAALIATTGYFREASTEIANARLIAAAPELLEAAQLVIAWYEAEEDHSKADFYKRMDMCRESEAAIRAAIAKATGA